LPAHGWKGGRRNEQSKTIRSFPPEGGTGAAGFELGLLLFVCWQESQRMDAVALLCRLNEWLMVITQLWEVKVEAVKKAQKELYRDLKTIEAEVQSLEETIAQVKALGHPAEEQEKQLEKVKQDLTGARVRIEDLWQYSVPYGRA